MNKKTKIVSYPIKVPYGKYCWDYNERICQYFNNTGGNGKCDLGFYSLAETKKGILKPAKCLNLNEIKS